MKEYRAKENEISQWSELVQELALCEYKRAKLDRKQKEIEDKLLAWEQAHAVEVPDEPATADCTMA